MAQDRQDAVGAAQAPSLPTSAGFDEGFAAIAASPGIRRVWEAVDPALPPEIEPFSFVSVDVQVESRAGWHELFTRVYRVALDLGGPGDDVALAGLQGEARQHLPLVELVDRVVAIATRPDGGAMPERAIAPSADQPTVTVVGQGLAGAA